MSDTGKSETTILRVGIYLASSTSTSIAGSSASASDPFAGGCAGASEYETYNPILLSDYDMFASFSRRDSMQYITLAIILQLQAIPSKEYTHNLHATAAIGLELQRESQQS